MSAHENPSTPAVSREIADFVARTAYADLPPDVVKAAQRSLVNFFATGLAGSGDVAITQAAAVLADFSGPPQATVIGRSVRSDALNAAFLNAAAANVHDFDDTHIPTIIHPTAPVAAALLAYAETRPVDGRSFLAALALGIDVECRIGNAVHPGHYRKGWHITSTCGVFGAAMAVGKLLGLDQARLLDALGSAAAQSSGLVETLGFMAKSVSVGNAARNGLLSALLAARGFAGPAAPLEGARGFFRVYGDDADPGQVTAELGTRWELLANSFKPYPAGVVLHAVLDACLALREAHRPDPSAIVRVIVTGHPLLRERADRPMVATGREAQVSAQHSAAVALVTGAAGLAQYSDAAVADPATQALRARVSVEDDANMPVGAAGVMIEMQDGRQLGHHIPHPRGSLERPLSDAELEAKLATLAAGAGAAIDTAALTRAIWSLDRSADAGALMTFVRPPA